MSHTDYDIEEKMYLNVLAHIPGVGARALSNLLESFGSAKSAWVSNDLKILKKTGLSTTTLRSWHDAKKSLDPHALWKEIEKHEIKLITYHDKQYPEKLKDIPLPPTLLYVRGTLDFSKPAVAIVGSRAYTEYGKRATEMFAHDLVSMGVTIISGLALGTDALAHIATLDAHGHTIGILGGGIDPPTITPHKNSQLSERILSSGGALMSEYPPGYKPHRGSFPARNRIMAGLADATLVIQARTKSGTLITARYAKQYGRPLFAVPGSIFVPTSHGGHELIVAKDAQLASCANDILGVIGIAQRNKNTKISKSNQTAKTSSYIPKNDDEKIILTLITKYPEGIHVDRIIKSTTLKTTTVSSALTVLEMNGAIVDDGGHLYRCV